MTVDLNSTERSVVERHLAVAGTADGARVRQWDDASSVYYARTGRLWVHNHTPRKQAYQELYFQSADSVANALTCSHTIKFWDLRRRATPRETARVQGFPEDFVLPTTAYNRLIGNAVAVPCATHACACVCHDLTAPAHVDLCAGVGGFSFALRAVCPGARCVGFSEVMPAAIKCYRANFPDAPALGDATAIDKWPACDVLTAGFPCQPFSTSNTLARREKHKSRDFFEIVLAAAAATGATRVVLENVPTIVTTGEHRWRALCDGLRALGFVLDHAVLNAVDFGVPQLRKRLYLVGRRGGGKPRVLANHASVHPPRVLRTILDPPQKKCKGTSNTKRRS